MKKFFDLFTKGKIKLYVLFALSTTGIYCAQAQVTIGANTDPHTGAVLELISNGNRGFLLPKINLTTEAAWVLAGTAVEGMMVFNDAATLDGKGIYVWLDDAKWHSAQNFSSAVAPINLGSITLSPAGLSFNKNNVFTASVPASIDAASYEWEITGAAGGILGSSNTNVISLVGITTGTYTIKVKAINSQGVWGGDTTTTVTIY
jgi:hypothetical protein